MIDPHIRSLLERDGFARHLGIEFIEATPGRARARMNIGPAHRNALGIVHGGAIMTLGDACMAAAALSGGGRGASVSANISYFKATRGPWLEAIATAVEPGETVAHYEVEVNDARERLIARLQCVVYLRRRGGAAPES